MASSARLGTDLQNLALAGEGWPAILRRLSEEAGRATRLVAVHGGVLATSERDADEPATSVPASGVPASDSTAGGLDAAVVDRILATRQPTRVVCTDGTCARAVPVYAGPRRIGLLLMEEPVGSDELTLLDAAVLPVEIEALRRDTEAAAIADSASRLIDELRFGSLRHTEQLVRAALRFGLCLDRPHAAAVFAYDGSNRRAWATAIRWIEMPARHEDAYGWTVLAGDVAVEMHRIRRRLAGIVGHGPVLAATGPMVSDPAETPRSFRDAEVVLALLRRRPDETELTFESLGFTGLLLSVPIERLATFVERQLGPIIDHPQLLETLAAWFDANGSRAAVADRLRIHRNSVGYRISRIRQLLGTDALDAARIRELQAALDAREVLAALSDLGRT